MRKSGRSGIPEKRHRITTSSGNPLPSGTSAQERPYRPCLEPRRTCVKMPPMDPLPPPLAFCVGGEFPIVSQRRRANAHCGDSAWPESVSPPVSLRDGPHGGVQSVDTSRRSDWPRRRRRTRVTPRSASDTAHDSATASDTNRHPPERRPRPHVAAVVLLPAAIVTLSLTARFSITTVKRRRRRTGAPPARRNTSLSIPGKCLRPQLHGSIPG